MGWHIAGPRLVHTRTRRTVIPGFLYVTFVHGRPKFTVQIGKHVRIS